MVAEAASREWSKGHQTVGQRLRVGGVGPPGAGHPLPGLRPTSVHHEQRQQRQGLRRVQRASPFASSVISCSPSRKTFNIVTVLLRMPR
jgi:hypothetical protein